MTFSRKFDTAGGGMSGSTRVQDRSVQLKARLSDEYGPPDRAVGDDKRAHLRRLARAYARKTDTPWERVRCDVVTVILSGRPQLQLVRGAFRI